MRRNNSDARLTTSSPQFKNKATNSDTKNINTTSNKHLVEKSDKETINNLKNLDRDKTLKRLTDLMFNHEVNSTDILLMNRAILNIQGLNEDSNAL